MADRPWEPGPWTVQDFDGHDWHIENVNSSEFRPVCTVSGPFHDKDRDQSAEFEQCRHTALLIEAAPELYDTLEKILGWLEGSETYAMSHGAHSDAVEARKLLDQVIA